MSTTIDAQEISAKRFPVVIVKDINGPGEHLEVGDNWFRYQEDAEAYSDEAKELYSLAIREVAQPIADERDEYREALRECELFIRVLGLDSEPARKTAENARAILAKYPKP